MQQRLMDMPEPDQQSPEAKPRKRRCAGKRFIQPRAREEQMLMPPSLDEMVAPDDPVRAVAEVMETIDMTPFEEAYRGGGRPAYPPRIVCGTVSITQDFGRPRRPLRRQTASIRWLRHRNPPGDSLGCVLASLPGA